MQMQVSNFINSVGIQKGKQTENQGQEQNKKVRQWIQGLHKKAKSNKKKNKNMSLTEHFLGTFKWH